MRSVRSRAAVGATVVVAVALVAAGIAVLAVLRGGLADNARLQAEATARGVAARVPQVSDGDVGDLDGLDDDDKPAQVVDARHHVLGAGEHLRGHGPMATFHLPEADDDDDDDDVGDDDGEDRTVSLPVDDDGEATYDHGDIAGHQDFQLVAVHSRTKDGTPVTVYAGSSLRDQQQAVSSVTTAMLIGLPVLLVVVAGVTWLVTRRALRPVEGIRGEMAAIMASTDLSRRVPEPDSRDEVARLARTTNATLAALQASVDRQRQLVADASHELRSPIASLRTQLEVGAAHPELLDVEGAVQDTVRLQDLAADLLLLARLDAGERPGDARVALGALVREEAGQRVGDAHPVRVERPEGAGEDDETEVLGSRTQLARVLGNLVDNAQRHARSQVAVTVRGAGRDWLELEVADDGAGVPEAERGRIFERFVRLDDARSRDVGGAGLGLAIVRDVVERHGGTVDVRGPEDADGLGGAHFVVRLPRAGGEAGATRAGPR